MVIEVEVCHDHLSTRNYVVSRMGHCLLTRGKRHYDSAELENLSDRSLEDIGLEVRKRDFGTLKPLWIP
jgi:uncharacterized protein YjiS (DUF1127 family)